MSSIRHTYESVQPFSPRLHQQEYLIDNPINQMKKTYDGSDTRCIINRAITGSGKTFTTIAGLIPEWVKSFYPLGKRTVGFICQDKGVVDATFREAFKYLDGKTIGNAKIHVYDDNAIKYHVQHGRAFPGDVVIFFATAALFRSRKDFFTHANLDLVIVDEAHYAFGTISAEDTLADKGVTNNNFDPVTLPLLLSFKQAAKYFLTATPSNSQQQLTWLGEQNNAYLPEFPIVFDTIPAFDVIEYCDTWRTLADGTDHFIFQIGHMNRLIDQISEDTWDLISHKIQKVYPASLTRYTRANSYGGPALYYTPDYPDGASYGDTELATQAKKDKKLLDANAIIFHSTSQRKAMQNAIKYYGGATFNKTVTTLDSGIEYLGHRNNRPVCIDVIDSGIMGMNLPRIKTIIMARSSRSSYVSNYRQTAGRASRMMFFACHSEAIDYIRELPLKDDQKRLVAEYYILHNTATIHLPKDNYIFKKVREDLEKTSYRGTELRSLILEGIFSEEKIVEGMYLNTETSLENDIYKHFKKEECEVCNRSNGYVTDCFRTFQNSIKKLIGNILPEVAKELWFKTLNVHHKDGDHFNNDPSNFITICPNVHGPVTLHEQHHLNRYPELRAKILSD